MKKFGSVSLGAIALASYAFTGIQAHAQDAFRRDRNVSVRERPRPEYDALGIRTGGFILYPEASLWAEENTNVFADDANKQDDLLTTLDLQARLRSNWNTHELNFSAEAVDRNYSNFSDQSALDWTIGADGRLDASYRLQLYGSASFTDGHEDAASSPTNATLSEPIPYQQTEAMAGVSKVFNRLRLTGEARYELLDYGDASILGGGTLVSDDRDHSETRYKVRADYAISPATALFISGEHIARNYDLDPPNPLAPVNRDSNGYEVLAGANFDITHVMRGEVGVGYLNEDYDEPGSESATGLAVHADVDWFPDELWTVSASARRETRAAGAAGALSYVEDGASLSADYEFRRNIIIGAKANFERDEYQGIDRQDDRTSATLRADYAVNRGFSLFGEVGHYEQDSSGAAPGRDYSIDRAVIGIRLRR